MREPDLKPNPDQPGRCPSIDPYNTLQCGRSIHEDDRCHHGGIAWKKGTPRYPSEADRVLAPIQELFDTTPFNQIYRKDLERALAEARSLAKS